MRNHKYQIFISSTYEDLKDERRAAIDAILGSGNIPVGMELFTADDANQKYIISRWVKQADIYVLILGARYGNIDPDTDISYTEWEYNLAEKLDKPRLVIILDDDFIRSKEYDFKKIETSNLKYQLFRKRLTKQRYAHFVSNIDQLKSKIHANIPYIIRENKEQLTGWIDGKYKKLVDSVIKEDSPYKNIIKDWGLNYIFRSRAEKNKESDPKLKDPTIKQLDGIAFGLKTFRSFHTDDIEQCLRNGMAIRLLTMNPESPYIRQREKEEHEVKGQISNSIKQLVEWGKTLKAKTGGNISIKYYNTMTLDFYWRVGDTLYVGPYLFGKASQATITYKYIAGGEGFNMYSQYFEDLWNDQTLTKKIL